MIIPNFKCHQDDEFVYIEISAPNARIQNAEFDLNENIVIFTSPPYHLRLNLPGNVEATEDMNCDWISDKNEFFLKVKKANKGECFEGLELISKLLTIPTEDELKRNKNLIEVIGESNDSNDNLIEEDDIFSEKFDLNSFQQSNQSILETKHKYGFLNKYSDLIEKYQNDLWNFTDIKNPGLLSVEQRRKIRIDKELNDFDEEYYLFDQYENNKFIDSLRLMERSWLDHQSNKSTELASNSVKEFTDDEIFRLKNLPKKEFLKLSKEEKIIVLYGLIDILFAYCYDKRINEGDQSPESAWNISKLSSTLSCFETFWEIDNVIHSCLRRSLCYPLYRNYELSKSVLNDVIKVLSDGRVCVIKCLLEIHRLFNEYGEFKYLLNDLYMDDYIVSIQYLDEKYLHRLVELLNSKISSLNKDDLNLDLVMLDTAADLTILELNENTEC